MSTDELRRLLDYPDDGMVVDLAAVRERAHRHQVRRRHLGAFGAIGAACAVAITTAATIGALAGSAPHTLSVTPSDESTRPTASPELATPSTVPTERPHAATVVTATGTTRVPMGQGWLVWVTAKGELCRSSPPDSGGASRSMPFGCRSTTDGNIAGLSVQSAGSPAGTMYSAVIPYRRARVDLVIHGKHLPAETVRFRTLKGWTFYYLWVPSTVADPSARYVGVVAYDHNGTKLDQFGVG